MEGARVILIFRVQGLYYILTALWPFAHLPSFVAVVGPKPDVFQLHTTSALILVIGAVLLTAPRPAPPAVVRLAVLSALAFIALEVAYAGSLREIYWLDAAAEALILAVIALTRRQWAG